MWGLYTAIVRIPFSIMESKTFLFLAQLMYQLGAGFQVVDRWMFLCGRFSAC